jgi:hypothetical protein
MPKVRSKTERSTCPIGHKESKYRHCKMKKGFIMPKVICEQKCDNKKCPIVKAILKEKRLEKLEKKKASQERKLVKERKKLGLEGITRNLLLRPEDRIK